LLVLTAAKLFFVISFAKERTQKQAIVKFFRYCRIIHVDSCKHLIRNGADVKIDPFYTAMHDYIRKKLIDAIVTEFGYLVTVKSEDFVS
jgi:translation initiation factor 2B subunit (eIF-2B alpha/beta/delta family)